MKFIKNNILILGDGKTLLKNLDKLFMFIYHNVFLDHENMKKLYDKVIVPVNFDDLDDDDDNYYRYRLKFISCKNKDDKYIYVFEEEDNDDDIFISELHNFLSSNTPKKLKIDKFTSIVLSNHKGINTDARGVRYLDWRLHFWEEFSRTKNNGITLHDFIIAAYKVKSHKFENNYECYCGIKFFDTINNTLFIDLNFDHGS